MASRNFGEAGKHFSIFTRDLGMISASAQGVRKISSKLRFILQDFAYLKIDLVAGKNIFRVTSASKTNHLEQLTKNKETFAVFANIARLLRRLLAGVEPNETLFAELLNGLSILEKSKTSTELRDIEAIIVLRIAHNLGYIGGNGMVDKFIKSPFENDIILEASRHRAKILSEINKALKETHL